MLPSSRGDTRDAVHQGSTSLPLDGLSECNADVLVALLSLNSDPVFRVLGSSVGAHGCSGPPNNEVFGECEIRWSE